MIEYIVQRHGRPGRERWSVERKEPHVANQVVAVYRQEHPAADVAAKLNQWAGSEEE